MYDHTGVFAVKYNGSTYFYRKDAQGNVVALLDITGAVVVKYKYDAWGNCKAFSGNGVLLTGNTHIGTLNPFRYRSYYYDTETKLYFLKTRYYDPEIGRFMTIDDISYLDPNSINGLNLYAYCLNNPIMMVDNNGCEPEWWQWALFGIGVALVVVAAGMAIIGTGGVAAFGMGALIGSVAVGGAGAVVGGVIGYATGGVEGILGGALAGFGIGAIVGFVVGGCVGLGVWKHDVKLARQFLSDNGVNANFHDEIINSFKYRIKVKNINADTKVYRYFSDPTRKISYWVTPKQYANPVQKLALAYGNNTATYSAELVLQSGSQVLSGTVANVGRLLGGGLQYYVPNLLWLV